MKQTLTNFVKEYVFLFAICADNGSKWNQNVHVIVSYLLNYIILIDFN